MSTSYATGGIEPHRRFEYWVDAVCSHCIPAASKPLTEEPFNASLDVSSVGAVEISQMIAPLHWWSRESVHLRKSPDDDLWIGYLTKGHAEVAQGARCARLGGGDLVFYDAARPFEFTLEANQIYLIRLPRASLVQRCPDVESLSGSLIESRVPSVLPLRSMIELAPTLDFKGMRPGAAARFGATLLDLIGVTLELQIGAVAPPEELGLYRQIMAYIHKNFEDPELDLEAIADAHGVSSRTVTRAFARNQQTAMGTVWQMRLEASHSALAEGRARTVTEAAFDYGFSDTSHFSRAFRKAFGYAPSTLLHTS